MIARAGRRHAAFALALALAGCTSSADELPPSFDTLRALRENAVPALGLGNFVPASPALGRAVTIRLSTMHAPGKLGYAGFLGETFAVELRAAGKLDPASPLRLEGVLTQSTASEDMAKGQAALAVHITLTRAGKPVLAKDYRVESTWRSDFIGAIAIPEAQRQFNALFALLVRKVLTDPELIAAARSG